MLPGPVPCHPVTPSPLLDAVGGVGMQGLGPTSLCLSLRCHCGGSEWAERGGLDPKVDPEAGQACRGQQSLCWCIHPSSFWRL